MRIITFLICLLSVSAFGQGVAIRSLNGDGTNTTIKGLTLKNTTASRPAYLNANGTVTNATGTPDGTKFLRDDGTLISIVAGISNVAQTAVGSGSLLTYTLTENGFTAGWGGNQPTFIFQDGTDKFQYAAIGYDDISNGSQSGQFSLRGRAIVNFGNLGGFHVNNMWLSGDNRTFVFRPKDPEGLLAADGGGYNLFETRFIPGAPDKGGDLYSNNLLFDNTGNVGIGHLKQGSDDPSAIGSTFRRPWAKVSVYGSSNYTALAITNGGPGSVSDLFEARGATGVVVISYAGNVGIGTNNPGAALHVVGGIIASDFTGSGVIGTPSFLTLYGTNHTNFGTYMASPGVILTNVVLIHPTNAPAGTNGIMLGLWTGTNGYQLYMLPSAPNGYTIKATNAYPYYFMAPDDAGGGGVGIPTLNGSGTNTGFYAESVVNVPVTINGFSGQEANLLSVNNSNGATVFKLASNGPVKIDVSGSLTSAQPLLELTNAWNNSGVTFTGIRYSLTDTASGASSLFLAFVNNVSGTVFSVNKSGGLTALGTSSFSSTLNVTGEILGSSNLRVSSGSNIRFGDSSTRLIAPADSQLRLCNAAQTDFARLIFGTAAAADPALSPNGAGLELLGGGGTATSSNVFSHGGSANNILSGCIFTSTADAGVTNSIAETSVIGAGVGTLTLPANFLSPGRTIRVTVRGHFSDDAVTPGTVTLLVKLGGTTVCTSGARTPTAGVSSDFWSLEADITCRTSGASGTVMGHGNATTPAAAFTSLNWPMINTGTTTIDTTATQAVDVTWDWGTADSDNSATGTIATIEVLR